MRTASGVLLLLLVLTVVPGVLAQDEPQMPPPSVGEEPPPPGGMVGPVRQFSLEFGVAGMRWDEVAPYEDTGLFEVAIERQLWRGIRGRASFALGKSAFLATEEPVDAWLYSIDLQGLFGLDFGPFRAAGVVPYALVGLGSLVTAPSGAGSEDMVTQAQSRVSYGGGVGVRITSRWEASFEVQGASVRLADPFDATSRETVTVQNLRWEGKVGWVF